MKINLVILKNSKRPIFFIQYSRKYSVGNSANGLLSRLAQMQLCPN
jgi:hypothetical protein